MVNTYVLFPNFTLVIAFLHKSLIHDTYVMCYVTHFTWTSIYIFFKYVYIYLSPYPLNWENDYCLKYWEYLNMEIILPQEEQRSSTKLFNDGGQHVYANILSN